MADVLAILRQDHKNLSLLLDALERELDTYADGGHPDMEIITAIADYVLEYPDRFHHPVEDLVLEAMRETDAKAAEPSQGLLKEHKRIGEMARDFHKAVEAWTSDEPARRSDFVEVGRIFIDVMREHIVREDNEFFPAAEKALPQVVRDRLAGRLPELDDPLFGAANRDSYLRLRRAILDWSDDSDGH